MLWSESSQGMQQLASAASQAAINDSTFIGNSMDGGHRSSAFGGGKTRVHHVMSDPSLRQSGAQATIDPAREPKFFDTMQRSLSETGVRCGGFQRLDWPSHNARP